MQPQPAQPIVTDAESLGFWSLIAAPMAVSTAWLIDRWAEFPLTAIVLALPTALLAAWAIRQAKASAGKTHCPVCATAISGIAKRQHGGIKCPQCRTLLIAGDKEISPRPPEPRIIDVRESAPVRRSWFHSIMLGLAAVELAAIAGAVMEHLIGGWLGTLVAVFPAIGVVALLAMAFQFGITARCPACHRRVDGLSRRGQRGICCPGCSGFLDATPNDLRMTAPDTIADSPMFGALVPDAPVFPKVCCVCGSAATRVEHLKWHHRPRRARLTMAVLSGGTQLPVTGALDVDCAVPHCDDHTHGAMLRRHDGQTPAIFFRSYPYQRQFAACNKTEAVGVPSGLDG